MRIVTYLNTTKKEVESKIHNICVGVSIGNKYFSADNIRKYVEWGLMYTKDDLLVFIADAIQAVNFEIFDKRNSASAHRKAIKAGDKMEKIIKERIDDLNDRKKVKLVRWEDVTNTEAYRENLKKIHSFYQANAEFRNYIIQSIKAGRPDKKDKFEKMSDAELDRLAEYVLQEIPFFVNGIEHGGRVYTLIPYPGLTMIDKLFIGLNNQVMFPELADKLRIENKIGILEAYTD
jgi:tRNA-dependent cyclodipeptide synthase